MTLRVLSRPLAGSTPLDVTVSSSNPGVATATATAVGPGEQTTALTIDAFQNGITVLTIRAGDEVWTITIVVGSASPGQTPIVLSPSVGLAISAPPSAGQIVSSAGRTSSITIQILSAPHGGSTPLPVSVTSSDPTIATAVASAVEPGSQTTTLTITTLKDGFVTFTVRAGSSIRSVGMFVGTPAPGSTPLLLAQPIGISVAGVPFIGKAFVRHRDEHNGRRSPAGGPFGRAGTGDGHEQQSSRGLDRRLHRVRRGGQPHVVARADDRRGRDCNADARVRRHAPRVPGRGWKHGEPERYTSRHRARHGREPCPAAGNGTRERRARLGGRRDDRRATADGAPRATATTVTISSSNPVDCLARRQRQPDNEYRGGAATSLPPSTPDYRCKRRRRASIRVRGRRPGLAGRRRNAFAISDSRFSHLPRRGDPHRSIAR